MASVAKEDSYQKNIYQKKLNNLLHQNQNPEIPLNKRIQLLFDLAKFYETQIGDYESALKYYYKIAQIQINKDINKITGEIASANENIERILLIKKKFQDQDHVLNIAKAEIGKDLSKNDFISVIGQLENLKNNYSEYYRKFELFYVIGSGYMRIDKYRSAYQAFEMALKLKPACSLYIPINSRIIDAHKKWISYIITSTSRFILLFFCLITIVLLFYSKPWIWVKRKHLYVGITSVLIWTAFFWGGFYFFGKGIESIKRKAMEKDPQKVFYFNATPFTPGSKIAEILFLYGLTGVLCSYLFAIATSEIKNSASRIMLNYLFGCILFTALLTHFYMLNCYEKAEFEPNSDNILYFHKGSLSFDIKR